ncbi:MAG: DUF229 domain-containing protein [Lentisphaerae bacterium]|nr:MAG: DUF229 domain-containing protein [Lentisphaerota bacterium]
MAQRPNILFLMTDQFQANVLDAEHPCHTPNLDQLRQRGVQIRNAYTTNAVCSPARAGIMTGLLPHNHGVLYVTHVVDDDQACLRPSCSHWARHLQQSGYATAYFGKWHVERSNRLDEFGWQEYDLSHGRRQGEFVKSRTYSTRGYHDSLFYGITTAPPEERPMGHICANAMTWLREHATQKQPWCCAVSLPEPHDPFVCGEEAFGLYDPETMPVPENWHDEMKNVPNIYRRIRKIWNEFDETDRRMAAACYYASITEIDKLFGKILEQLASQGVLDNTIVVFTTDHGELLGAHGLYCKNFGAYEEVYRIPLIVAGPGIPATGVLDARVGSHELAHTLCELAGAEPLETTDGRSFVTLLRDPEGQAGHFQTGYAESFGGRFIYTQRIYWEGPWKYVFNGFDDDELYNLQEDPGEMNNRIHDPSCSEQADYLMGRIWQKIRETGDHSLLNSHYPILRLGRLGPDDPLARS